MDVSINKQLDGLYKRETAYWNAAVILSSWPHTLRQQAYSAAWLDKFK